MAFTQIANSATIGTTEYYLGANSTTKSLQTTQCILQVFISFSAMAAGDQYQIKLYREINNTETSIVLGVLTGAQSGPFIVPAIGVGGASGAWDISVTKLTGTDRSIGWELFEIT